MTQEHGTQHATIQGEVTYREGDGMPVPIPEGPVELTHAPDSVTLSWKADNDAAGLAAMPRDQFERYAREGKILVDGRPAVAPEAADGDADTAEDAQRQQLQGAHGDQAGDAQQDAQHHAGQSQGQSQSQSQSQNPGGIQLQGQGSGEQPVPDPEVSQDGHAVEHDYTEDLNTRQNS